MAGITTILTAFVLLEVVGVSWSKITVTVKLVMFENTQGVDLTGVQCDRFNECDHRFSICLDNYDSDDRDQSNCQYSQSVTGTFQDQNAITFTDDMQSVSNPIVASVPDGQMGIHLKVAVTERDTSDFTGEFCFLSLDLLALRLNITSIPHASRGLMVHSLFKLTSLIIDFSAFCSPPYFLWLGTCKKYCAERDDQLGHYTCSTTGDKICLQGWLDVSTNCTTRDGNVNCRVSECENGGTCLDTDLCACPTGFQGITCSEKVDECISQIGQPNRCSDEGNPSENTVLEWFLKNKALGIGLVVGLFIVILLLILAIYVFRKRKAAKVAVVKSVDGGTPRNQKGKRHDAGVSTVSTSYAVPHSGNKSTHYQHLRHPYESLRYQKPPSGTYLKPTVSKNSTASSNTYYEITD